MLRNLWKVPKDVKFGATEIVNKKLLCATKLLFSREKLREI